MERRNVTSQDPLQTPRAGELLILETERLILRRQVREDTPALVALWTDEEVTRYMGGPRDPDKLQEIFEATATDPFAELYDLWPVLEKDTGRVVGHCGVLDKDVEGRQVFELVYVFVKAVWGRGYATEMACALRDYAFENFSLAKLSALIEPENTASACVAQKVGMGFIKEVMRPGNELRHLYAVEAPVVN
jgi:RimJ/RimL family protein N-acetyltransferase